MYKSLIIRLSAVATLSFACLAMQNGGCSHNEGLPGVITNVRGQVLFISENATDRGAALQEAVDAGVKLHNANLAGTTLRDIRLAGADLQGADFSGSLLEDVDFSRADLTQANFTGARFVRVRCGNAKLRGTTLAFLPAVQ